MTLSISADSGTANIYAQDGDNLRESLIADGSGSINVYNSSALQQLKSSAGTDTTLKIRRSCRSG